MKLVSLEKLRQEAYFHCLGVTVKFSELDGNDEFAYLIQMNSSYHS